MTSRFPAIATLCAATLLTAGCISMPFGGDTRSARPAPRPVPLAAAPAGSVTAAPLPPPAGATLAGEQAPVGLAALGQPSTGQAGQPGAGSVQVGRTDLLGAWTVSAAGDSCQLFVTLTTWSGGYRASTKGCSNATLQKVSAWNLEGSQVQLFNDSGATVARLYPADKTRFNGQTEGGGPISVFR
jgi:hypothetical protein